MRIAEVNSRLTTHEAVCEERHKILITRIARIESIMLGSAGAIILLLLGILLK